MPRKTPKPYFCHRIPSYYDWDGYVTPIEDYVIWHKCHIRTRLRRKIYQRNWTLYPPKPRTPEEIAASEEAFRKSIQSREWMSTLWSAHIWQRVQYPANSIYDALSGKMPL